MMTKNEFEIIKNSSLMNKALLNRVHMYIAAEDHIVLGVGSEKDYKLLDVKKDQLSNIIGKRVEITILDKAIANMSKDSDFSTVMGGDGVITWDSTAK